MEARRVTLSATGLAVMLAVCAGVADQAGKSGPVAGPASGAISGVVTEETTGRALAGVVVSLQDARVTVSRRTITDSKGRFVFRGLPASEGYLIDASRPGYAAGGLSRLYALILSASSRIPLAEGEWIPDVKVIMLRLGSISGTVVDEHGEPIVSVPVRAISRIPVAGTTRWAAGPAATTDDRGVYRIAGLRPGAYVVAVPSVQSVVPLSTPPATVAGLSPAKDLLDGGQIPRIAGVEVDGSWLIVGQYAPPPPISGRLQAYPSLFYPNARSLTDAARVILANGEERRNIDFSLQPGPTVQISGRIIGPSDVVSGLVVRLLPQGAEDFGNASEQATSLVGPDGAFTLVGVPAGGYTLLARTSFSYLSSGGGIALPATPGMVSDLPTYGNTVSTPAGASFVNRLTRGHEAYFARVEVTVGSQNVSNLDVELQRGAAITGRIVREDGMRLPATLSVWVEPATGDPALGGSASHRDVGRDPAGGFSIKGLQRGEYLLRVFAGGGFLVKSIAADGDYTSRPFDATPGSDITNVIVTLTDRVPTLSGAVRDREGGVVKQGAVIVFPVDREQWTRFGLDPPRIKAVTYLGSRGYQVPRLPAGEYYAIAVESQMRDAWHDPRFFSAAAPLATRVILSWGASSAQDLTIQRVTLK